MHTGISCCNSLYGNNFSPHYSLGENCEIPRFSSQWQKEMDLITGSINARGLGDRTKRRELFNWLRKKQLSMYFIQEGHCTENNMHDWRAEWGYQALFSCYTSTKAGVIILFNNNFTFQISRTYCDPEGWFIICDVMGNEKQLTLVNLYAPNDDDPTFSTSEHLTDIKCNDIIIGGDYNFT